jgi:hypothetical protein
MPLPEFIQVKLSSEAAESISITRVIVQQMARTWRASATCCSAAPW